MPGWRYSFKLLALLDMTSYLSLSDGETSLLSSGNDHCLNFSIHFYSIFTVPMCFREQQRKCMKNISFPIKVQLFTLKVINRVFNT